jgi:uncharacterized protein YbaR (Trm112 family)
LKPARANPDPKSNVSSIEAILDLLACPACEGALRVEGTAVLCDACGRRYPVVDGIPVLIANQISAEL